MLVENEVGQLTVNEVASRQHLTAETVRQALKNGRLKGYQIGGRKEWRIAVADYQQWLNEGRQTSPVNQPNKEQTE